MLNKLNNFVFVVLLYLVFTSCNKPDSYVPQKEVVKKSKEQRIEDRIAQEFEMTVDPALGIVPRKELIKARKETQKQLAELIQKAEIPNVTWDERGPNNIGGRTRTLMFDPNDSTNKKVWAGSVGGGLWYSNDITATNANWQNVDDFWSNMAVSSMDHDPVNTNVFYVGTGEGFGNADAIDGDGIWKSTDGGTTWNQMSNTTSFNDCNKVLCFKSNHILVATNNGLRLSTNAGSSWTTVISGSMADAEVSKDGDLYASNFSGDIYKSTNDGATWTTVRSGSESRVELATAPSDNNYVYAIIANGSSVGSIIKSVNAGSSWTSLTVPAYKEQNCNWSSTNDFTRGQAWYDLIMLVNETDKDKIIIGGVDLYRSQNGGSSWETISYWTGGCDAYVHADQHALVTRPGNPNEVISGSDGGVAYSANAFTSDSNPTWNIQNENYNVTQFYAVAVHPTANNILAGAQDNGTKRLANPGIGSGASVTGGDGAFCHIDQDTPNSQITSYVYNNYYISSNGTSFPSYSLGNFGRFINPTDYDNNANKLYCASGNNAYIVISGIGGSLSNTEHTVSGFNGQVSCVKVSPNNANTVYFGISGQRICKVTNAATSPVFTNLGNPSSGYISSIDVEVGNENHLLATYSNYGVTSVVESTNGGTTWTPCEGDLPNIPVRWGIFNPNDANQVLLATEIGVWTTDNLNGNSTDWAPTNSGLANVRVDMIEYRASDKLMVAGTHGRGVFTSESFNFDCLISDVQALTQVCDPVTNTYSQEISMKLINTPGSGNIIVNGQTFTFPLNSTNTTQTYTLTNLVADGNPVDVSISYSAEPSCNKNITNLFTAANPNCALDNINCQNAALITASGVYTTNGPADGNGCHNCSSATHADWFKFTAPSDGLISFESCLEGVDTRFWLYSGNCNNLTALIGIDDNCEMTSGGFGYASTLSDFSVLKDVSYYIEWDDRWDEGGFDMDFTFVSSGGCAGTDHLFVDVLANGDGSGCDWANAINNLQDAIDQAVADPSVTQLWVKSGNYKPGKSGDVVTRSTSFNTDGDIEIYGGFNGTEGLLVERDFLNNVTILSGDVGISSNNIDNAYHVINHSGAAKLRLDGFTIQDGNANIVPNLSGAAIQNAGDLSLYNCILKNNNSTNSGSAILNTSANAKIKMENVSFENNSMIPFLNADSAELRIIANSSSTIAN